MVSRRSSAMRERSRINPMKVKNGIASSTSFDMIAKTRSGRACRKFGVNRPSQMPSTPKISPMAASEKETG
jgi:hypothetical protein